jgi:cysteine desulfurase
VAGAIYFDHNATTPLLPEIRAAMTVALEQLWGNPSSIHSEGRRARAAVEAARQEVAALVGGLPEEIVFTSGGTEGDNLAIRGLALAAAVPGRKGPSTLPGTSRPHVVSSALEHPAVAGALTALEQAGMEVTRLPVDPGGLIAPEALERALRDETVLVTLGLANHEIGVVQPIAALAAMARARRVLFHTDAVQAAGRLPVDVGALGVDALTLSAHKLHGPKGVGAVWVRRGLLPAPLVAGGHQERERRGGTENVVGIVGFGEACRRARAELAEGTAATSLGELRDRLEARLLAIPGARVHGDRRQRVPGTTNVGFADAAGELVLINLDLEGVCVSTGAACTSGTLAPSPVLLALGLDPIRAREAVRFSLGRGNTRAEVDHVAALLETIVARVRAAA